MATKFPAKSLQNARPCVPASPGFSLVGISASAGQLAAFEAVFSDLLKGIAPVMPFVLVQHLAPEQKSVLSELIRHHTRRPAYAVEHGMPIQISCVYTIAPNRDMAHHEGKLQMLETAAPRCQRLPSLARWRWSCGNGSSASCWQAQGMTARMEEAIELTDQALQPMPLEVPDRSVASSSLNHEVKIAKLRQDLRETQSVNELGQLHATAAAQRGMEKCQAAWTAMPGRLFRNPDRNQPFT